MAPKARVGPAGRRAQRALTSLRRHPARATSQRRSRSTGSGFAWFPITLVVVGVALYVADGDPKAAKALIGATAVPAFVAWGAGMVAIHAERWWSRLLGAVIAVSALGAGVWLTLWVLDEL